MPDNSMPDSGRTLLINGAWRAASDQTTLPLINPATGAELTQIAQASARDIGEACRAAADAFPQWAALSGRERATILQRAAAIYRERYLDESARLLTLENGKPLNDSLKECRYSADVLDFYAAEARRLTGTHFSGDQGPTHSFVFQQPIGVVAAIIPWNFPVDLLAWKIGPGLAAGCSFVIKPSEEALLATSLLARACEDAGLPPGTLNLLTGDGAVGAALVEQPEVALVAFTGSVATGKRVAQAAARGLKRTLLELGGSAPFIVCRDANLDIAVPEALRRCFSHTGQICISVNRIFVQRDLLEEFTDRFVASASQLRVTSDGLAEPAADMGPLMNARAVAHVQTHINQARSTGAVLLLGGGRPTDAHFPSGGFYLQPTVLGSVSADMRVMQEETFGPVAPIASFTTLDDAIRAANSTPYGLAAYLYTQDLDAAFYASQRLRFGGIGINVNDVTDIRAPFGGMKQSGLGRELGEPGLDAYREMKHVRYRYQAPRQ